MKAIDKSQIGELSQAMIQHQDEFNQFVAELNFVLDAYDILHQSSGALSDTAVFGAHLLNSRLKSSGRCLSQDLSGLSRTLQRISLKKR